MSQDLKFETDRHVCCENTVIRSGTIVIIEKPEEIDRNLKFQM